MTGASTLDPAARAEFWPALPYPEWAATARTLQLWTQVIGKIRLSLTPWINHSWHVTLYLTARGLTTGPMAYGLRGVEIRFDFISHELRILTTAGKIYVVELKPKSVAEFYREVMSCLAELGIRIEINPVANELPETVRLDQDEDDRAYDREYVSRFWRVLVQSERVFTIFRSRFCGKCSPVHFFWGSFDLAVTRFSGRPAPPHPGGVPHLPNSVAREAYSQEVSSLGFWPGNPTMPQPVYYSYAYPAPDGFADAAVTPKEASFDSTLREFILPYDLVRQADNPDEMILEFAQTTYDRASALGGWDKEALEEKKPALRSA